MKLSPHKFNPRNLQHAVLGGVMLAALVVTGAYAATGEPMPMQDSTFAKADSNHVGMLSADEFAKAEAMGKAMGKAK